MGEDEDEEEEDDEEGEEVDEVEEVEDDDACAASAASAASAIGRGAAAAEGVSSEPSPSGGGGGGRSRTRRRRRARAVPAPFPQEVLQAVVRGAVDQSVECALGAGALRADDDDGGPGATRGFFSPTPPDADAFPRRSRDRVAPPFERVAEREHPLRGAASGGFDEERADSEEDAAVAEDAAGLYGMVRDALRARG